MASFAGCLVLLALSKNLYAVAGLLALLVPRERFSSPRRRWEYVVGVLAAITGEFLAWTLLVLNRVRVVVPFLLDDSFVQREWVRSHPVDFARIAVHSAFGTMLIPTHTWPTTIANTRPALGRTAVAPPAVSLIALGLAVLALAMSRTRPGTSAGRRRTTFDRAAVYVVPLVILLTVLALVLYGEALTFTPPLASGVRITFVEGRFFLPVLGVFLLPFSRSTQCETHDGRTWVGRAGWTVLIGSVGIAVVVPGVADRHAILTPRSPPGCGWVERLPSWASAGATGPGHGCGPSTRVAPGVRPGGLLVFPASYRREDLRPNSAGLHRGGSGSVRARSYSRRCTH